MFDFNRFRLTDLARFLAEWAGTTTPGELREGQRLFVRTLAGTEGVTYERPGAYPNTFWAKRDDGESTRYHHDEIAPSRQGSLIHTVKLLRTMTGAPLPLAKAFAEGKATLGTLLANCPTRMLPSPSGTPLPPTPPGGEGPPSGGGGGVWGGDPSPITFRSIEDLTRKIREVENEMNRQIAEVQSQLRWIEATVRERTAAAPQVAPWTTAPQDDEDSPESREFDQEHRENVETGAECCDIGSCGICDDLRPSGNRP